MILGLFQRLGFKSGRSVGMLPTLGAEDLTPTATAGGLAPGGWPLTHAFSRHSPRTDRLQSWHRPSRTGLAPEAMPTSAAGVPAGGRFRTEYRFRYVTGLARIRFRAELVAARGFPYATTASKPVSVRVSG